MSDFLRAIGFVRSISDATKRLLEKREESKVNEVAIHLQGIALDLQSEIMMIQAEYQKALNAKEELEKKLAKQKNWDHERERYALKRISGALFVYALKQSESGGEPAHWICPNCYEDSRKSLLQKDHPMLSCPKCNFRTNCHDNPSW